MLKMILADDEPVITRGIQKLIDWNLLGIEIVGEYSNGKRALEGILCLKPDIALLDISMPEITGVEILKQCKNMDVKTKIIFISGFQDFEYAKAAIKYGALDYLLKPIIREELLNAVEKCFAGISNEKNKEEKENTNISKKDADYSKLIELEETFYVPIYTEVIYKDDENVQMKKLIHFSFMSFLEEYLDANGIGITFTRNENIVVVLKGLDREGCKIIVEKMWRAAVNATGHGVVFVVGNTVEAMGDIPTAFEECLLMRGYFFFADQMEVPMLFVNERVFNNHIDSKRLSQTREKLLDAVIAQNTEAFEKQFEQFGKQVCQMSDGKKEDACFYFCSAIRLIDEKFNMLGLPNHNMEMKDLLDGGRKCSCYSTMLSVYKEVFEKYVRTIQSSVVNNDKKDILKAKDYIEKHYKENLTLNVLASEIHMNPYYFSSFFKKNAGENFKDYVNRVRIGHAVSLLLSTNMRTYEIANEVGFSDARSFTDIFHRIYKETPSAYRKRVSTQEGGLI